jgi:hypothetical protein
VRLIAKSRSDYKKESKNEKEGYYRRNYDKSYPSFAVNTSAVLHMVVTSVHISASPFLEFYLL